VFTPIEYGCIGYSEEDAIKAFGAESIEVGLSVIDPFFFSIQIHSIKDWCLASF